MEVSPHTNRPITAAISYPVIFWCQTCQVKLGTPTVALTHLNGRSHKAKLSARKDEKKENAQCDTSAIKYKFNTISKGKLVETTNNLPKEKSVKCEPNNITCEDCKLVFDNHVVAIQHFKGKRHVAKIASKVAAKQSERGRGRGGGGGRGVQGRVDGYWRGRGLPGPANNFYDRRFNMFDHAKENFYMNPMQPCGPPRNSYGGGYYNGFCDNGVPDYRSQHYPPNCLEDRVSSDGEPVNSLLSEPRPKSDNEYFYDYNGTSNNATENKGNTKKNRSKGGPRTGSWLPGRGRGILRGAYNGYNNSGYNNKNGIGGNIPWWENHFIKGPSMRGINKYEY